MLKKKSSHDPGQLLDLLLPNAPALVREKSLLPAFDWRRASSSQARDLLSRLADAKMTPPAWLVRDLLLAGHELPDALAPNDPALRTLASLNAKSKTSYKDFELQSLTLDRGSLDVAVASRIIERLLELGEATLAALFACQNGARVPQGLRAARTAIEAYMGTLAPISLRVAGFTTASSLADALKPAFASIGFRATVDQATHNSVMHELTNEPVEADALILLLDVSWFLPASWGSPDERRSEIESRVRVLTSSIRSYCETNDTPVLINTLAAPLTPAAGYADRTYSLGETSIRDAVNGALTALATTTPLLQLIDIDLALSALRPADRLDARLWFYGRFAYSDAAIRMLAYAMAEAWKARLTGPAKVLALDFDNTLWGGIFGDDGVDRLLCGDDYPGSPFKAFQQECLRLRSQGMLLVALSKNNPDALTVFDTHPGMALKLADFAATAVNWDPKSDNIRSLAKRLNLGLESFVFLDDSPHEREAMRRLCPAVVVPEMPAHPEARPAWLRALRCTWPTRITAEDAARSQMYAIERKAQDLKSESATYEEFLAGLKQVLIIEPLTSATIARAAQLHQRTNQFNLTNLRYTEADLRSFLQEDGKLAFTGRVVDCFGDHGITIAATLARQDKRATIMSFVMSCRVMCRQVEHAFLSALAAQLSSHGVTEIEGVFRATPKNKPAAGLYRELGFTLTNECEHQQIWIANVRDLPPGPREVEIEWRSQ